MKKRKICISVMIMMLIGVTVLAGSENKIEANIVDYMIAADGGLMNDFLGDPIISYKDRTYVSLRDYANYYDKDIEWDEELEMITMQDKRGKTIINDEKTGEMICKAIIEENYADRITDKTVYSMREYSVGRDLYFGMTAEFENSSNILVTLSRYTGEITITDVKDSNQNPHIILPRERADN